MDFSSIIRVGLTGQAAETVTDASTAAAQGSGSLPVYATPRMVALMEAASLGAVDPLLPEGWSTVGTALNIKHLSATPVGMRVTAKAELVEIDRRRLVFQVKVDDEAGLCGEGTHERFIVENAKFVGKAEGKKGGQE
jgi:predicted thioesterase